MAQPPVLAEPKAEDEKSPSQIKEAEASLTKKRTVQFDVRDSVIPDNMEAEDQDPIDEKEEDSLKSHDLSEHENQMDLDFQERRDKHLE